jgi:hypothetical protein
MVFPVVGGDGKPTGYEIENSCQFNLDAHCEFTPSSGSGSTQFTMSAWIKNAGPGGVSEDGYIISGKDADNGLKFLSGSNNGKMQFIEYDGGDNAYYIRTNRLFRDPSAWFHVVLIYDAPDGTAGDRMRLYINGTRETSFAAEVQLPSDRANAGFTRNNVPIRVGANASGSNSRFNGYLADVYFCDGQNYEPTEFGETNDNGVWIPKEADVSFGTNGFKLEFKQTGTSANSSGIGADTSGNDNHFSVSGLAATNITTDTPTNNFATLNPLIPVQQVPVYSEGNTKVVFKDGGNGCSPLSTFAVNSGKFYFEAKFVQTSDPGHGAIGVGIVDADKYNPYGDADDAFDLESFGYSYTTDGNAKTSGNDSSFGDEFNSGDIIGVAVDFDNRQIYYSKNGTFQDSGDPTSGASGTGSAHNFSVGTYYFAVYAYQDENSWEMNFGNAPFSISSSNSDGNGYGSFEYAVPSGYFALCTKNLAEHG